MINIESMSLHDAYMTGVKISTIKDHFDCVIIELEGADFRERFGTEKVRLSFEGCYRAQFNMQMWICGKDSVRRLSAIDCSEWLDEVAGLRDKGLLPQTVRFRHFSLELNTSGSTIEILAIDVNIEPLRPGPST